MIQTKFISKKKNYIIFYLFFLILTFFLLINVYLSWSKEEQAGEAKTSNSYKSQHGLPIMVIDTKGQEIEASLELEKVEINGVKREVLKPTEKYTVEMKLYDPNLFADASVDETASPLLESDMIMNIRGQSSLKYEKKQYTIRLIDKHGLESPQELLGMNSHDKWVLNGMYSDKSLIRNKISYKLGRNIMDYAPDTRYVEVYLKNTAEELNRKKDYIGVYLLTEKIERDKNRIDIEKSSEKYKDVSFIISRDKIKLDDIVLENDWSILEDNFIVDANNNVKARTVFTTTYPSKSNMTALDEKRIEDYINKFEYALRSSDFTNKREGYRKYIDENSFIEYALINELTKNIDGGEVSAYFHKDIGGRMKAGPIWDFDQSLGNTHLEEINEPTGFRMINVVWFERLFQDEAFVKKYKTKYKQYRNTIWSDKNIDKLVDEALLELGSSIDRNREKWYEKDSKEDYEKEVEDIRSFLKKRLDWMDENIHLIKRVKENAVE